MRTRFLAALVLALAALSTPAARAGAQWITYPADCSAARLSLRSTADSVKLRCGVDRARVDRQNQAITASRADSVALLARARLASAYRSESTATAAYRAYLAAIATPPVVVVPPPVTPPPVVDPPVTTPPVTTPPAVGLTGPIGPATIAELPRVTPVTTYPAGLPVQRVASGADFQAALNAAACGSELVVPVGAVFTGNYTLPAKACTGWIVIRTDLADAVLGAAGTRMTPTRSAALRLARFQTPGYGATFSTAPGAHHFRFTGVDVASAPGVPVVSTFFALGTDEGTQTSANTPHDLIIDRSYVHGGATQEVHRCVALNSATTSVVDSWLAECHGNNGDTQAIAGWNGPGPFLIQNNHLEAGHEVVTFGGGTFTVAGGAPGDITIRGNHITRPQSWRGVWQVKNLFETKNVRRVLLEGNVFENNWSDAQNGFAILIKSENQDNDNPWTQSADVTIRWNRIRCTGSGITLAGQYSNTDSRPSVISARLTVYDNIVEQVNVGPCVGDGIAWQLLNGAQDVGITHNTVANSGPSLEAIVFDGDKLARLGYLANIVYAGQYGVHGSQSPALPYFAPGSAFSGNAIIGGDVYPLSCTYPAGNTCPATLPATLPLASDGRAIGADVARVNAATAGAVVAP